MLHNFRTEFPENYLTIWLQTEISGFFWLNGKHPWFGFSLLDESKYPSIEYSRDINILPGYISGMHLTSMGGGWMVFQKLSFSHNFRRILRVSQSRCLAVYQRFAVSIFIRSSLGVSTFVRLTHRSSDMFVCLLVSWYCILIKELSNFREKVYPNFS